MKLSLFLHFVFILISLSPFPHPSESQQEYDPLQFRCGTGLSKGYFCNGIQKSCTSFLTLRSKPGYNTPGTIASLLGSESSIIASINNVSKDGKFPHDKLITVPVYCSCWGSIYQHSTTYTVKAMDTYFSIENQTYQGLTTCQALYGQNYYFNPNQIAVGVEVMVPLRCACPTQNQSANGVTSLMTYVTTSGDSLSSIAKKFRVATESIEASNQMDGGLMIYPFTPILVPIRSESCGGNSTGNPLCQCPNGQYAYEMQDGYTCAAPGKNGKGFPLKLVAILGAAIGVGLLCLAFVGYYLWIYLRKRKEMIRREKFFKQNGGLFLEQRLSSYGGGEKAKIFAAKELEKATDNFNQSRVLGCGGYGTVYKGMLLDGTIVAIKRSKAIDRSQIQQFINEVVILSQINHRNIVKLLGCCLETEFPLLVYEFIPNGTLFHHIHNQDPESTFSWEDRFRIATEVAGAVAYMHSAASIPIFHRDIKPSNILLDEEYSAKVSDFGTSRLIPHDKTHLTTDVQGTFGYLDPEYFQSSQFTDKSDVYSFGVVLVELLTGEKAVSFARSEEERNLVAHFISSAKENRLLEIIDPQVGRESKIEDIYAVANLAIRCLRLNGKKRPTMKEVVLELEGLRKSHTCLEVYEGQELMREDGQSEQGSPEESLILSMDLESP